MVLADGNVYKYPGHFYVANRQVNVQTGTIKMQGLFPNPGSILRPGLYAKIRSPTDTLKGALLVPPAAVIETQGQYQVAVVGADNKVTIQAVTLGKLSGNLRIIESGVTPGEHVITEGLQKVSDGMEVVPTLARRRPPPQVSLTRTRRTLQQRLRHPKSNRDVELLHQTSNRRHRNRDLLRDHRRRHDSSAAGSAVP